MWGSIMNKHERRKEFDMFYKFDQNNSYGRFDVNDKVCQGLFIEADNEGEAIEKAEELGCYWDGVEEGIDCPCCGDRWSKWCISQYDFHDKRFDCYTVSTYNGLSKSGEERWQEKFGSYEVVEKPVWRKSFGIPSYEGKIRFKDIEEYAQYLADEYGWTTPDVRIYYKDGSVKEIYSRKEGLENGKN